MTYVEIWTR